MVDTLLERESDIERERERGGGGGGEFPWLRTNNVDSTVGWKGRTHRTRSFIVVKPMGLLDMHQNAFLQNISFR